MSKSDCDKTSPEDKELLLALQIIKTLEEKIMATLQDALDKANQLKSQNSDLLVKVANLETESQNAFNRLDGKLAVLQAQITDLHAQIAALQGQAVDTQPLIDVINSIGQAQTDATGAVDSATATAKLEGQ